MKVGQVLCCPAIEVMVSVIADAVSLLQYILKNAGLLAYIVANTKKSGFGVIGCQLLQHPGREPGDGAVIKGQVEDFGLLVSRGDAPGKVRK